MNCSEFGFLGRGRGVSKEMCKENVLPAVNSSLV